MIKFTQRSFAGANHHDPRKKRNSKLSPLHCTDSQGISKGRPETFQGEVRGRSNRMSCKISFAFSPDICHRTSPDGLLRCPESQGYGKSFWGSWWLTPANDLCLNFFIILHVSNYIRDLGTNVTYSPINPKCLVTVIFVIQLHLKYLIKTLHKPMSHKAVLWLKVFFLGKWFLSKCCPYQPLAPSK